jgi:septal ring factor EnvC (AmiA/AmiB activator)
LTLSSSHPVSFPPHRHVQRLLPHTPPSTLPCHPLTIPRLAEDLKETRDRLTSEIDGLNRQITRKERMQEEALGRARTAEKTLGEVQTELREVKASQKEKIKALEEGAKRSEEMRGKAEREYASLREGIKYVSFSSFPYPFPLLLLHALIRHLRKY